uniref:NADH-ubiquinone oxidoreductase 9 kDa subunit n=1 Tax=Rhabditophanes sp. KR3021 TaxID=114890 RepID=A0AC35TVM4_9BILA
MASGIRDTLCNLGPLGIPRPTIKGFNFVKTRGTIGFYKTIRAEGEKYGVSIKPQGPRRSLLPSSDFWNQGKAGAESEPVKENNNNEKVNNFNLANVNEMADQVDQIKLQEKNNLKDYSNAVYARPQKYSSPKMTSIEETSYSTPECPEPDYDSEPETSSTDSSSYEKESPKPFVHPRSSINPRPNYCDQGMAQFMGSKKYNVHDLPPLPRKHVWPPAHYFNQQQSTLIQKL